MKLFIRWTIGDVSDRGFEALALSILGARAVFGPAARYVVCVNTITVGEARQRVGAAAARVEWRDSTREAPPWLFRHVDYQMAEGVAWKFAPIHLFRDCHTLSLDNDVILWRLPDSVRRWMNDGDSLLTAEDVKSCYGQFAPWCPPFPRNSGIRGFPPGHDTEQKIRMLLGATGAKLSSETDEQGLHVALISAEKHRVVRLEEVSICGYFRPHLLGLGSCGAHFVGVNAKRLPWTWNGRSGEQYHHAHWDSKKPEVLERLAANSGAVNPARSLSRNSV
jgi:hypothetical protein